MLSRLAALLETARRLPGGRFVMPRGWSLSTRCARRTINCSCGCMFGITIARAPCACITNACAPQARTRDQPGEGDTGSVHAALKSDPIRRCSGGTPSLCGDSALADGGQDNRNGGGLLGCWRRVTQGEAHLRADPGRAGDRKSRLAEELFRVMLTTILTGSSRTRPLLLRARPARLWARSRVAASGAMQLRASTITQAAARRIGAECCRRSWWKIRRSRPPQPLTESWQRRHFYEALNAAFARRRNRCCCSSMTCSGAITIRSNGCIRFFGPAPPGRHLGAWHGEAGRDGPRSSRWPA